MSVLLKIDNTMAVAYINNQGGTVSKELVSLTRDLWMWCLERNIHIQAQHLPGIMNDVADRELRSMKDRSDWKLNRSIFLEINEIYGPLEVDLFVSRLTNQCHHYFSWRPDPFAVATDAFLQDWTRVKGFANPPWNLIPRVLMKAQCQGADIILVTPVWKTQPWYPLLLSMLVDWPCLLPEQDTITVSVPIMPQLAMWSISGKDWGSKAFQARLRTSSSNHGGRKPIRHMTHCLGDGIAGVLNGGSDPFSGPVSAVANFLVSLFQDGYQYNSVNAYRSAISSVHEKVDGVPVGQHPVITRLIKGVFNERPLVPRYSNTWDLQRVLSHLESLGQSESLSLKALSFKTVFLLAITRPSRSADLSQLDISRMRSGCNGVTFLPVGLARQGRAIESF